MESAFDRAQKATGTYLTKVRWALGINGVLAIAVGVVILVWPGISLYALTLLFGAYTLATGIVGLAAAFSGDTPKDHRAWLIFMSLLGIAIGVVVFAWPNISALALLYVIAAYAIVFGIITVVGGFWLPLDGSDTALLVLSGLVSIAFGVVMFAKPGDGALVLLALIAAYAIVTGLTELIVAIGGKRLLESDVKRALSAAAPQKVSPQS
jgi:uncharacterized membrane protein HdeD (DUF308 family)